MKLFAFKIVLPLCAATIHDIFGFQQELTGILLVAFGFLLSAEELDALDWLFGVVPKK